MPPTPPPTKTTRREDDEPEEIVVVVAADLEIKFIYRIFKVSESANPRDWVASKGRVDLQEKKRDTNSRQLVVK